MRSIRQTQHEYDRQAAAYDERWARYLHRTTEPIIALLRPEDGDRILDIGCGTGALLDRLSRRWPEARPYGLELSFGMLQRARERLGDRAHLVQGDGAALPFADGSFSTVLSTSSLRYWLDSGRVLRGIARVLQPRGQLLLLDWSGDALRHRLLARWLTLTGRVGGHVYRQDELAELLRAAGFEPEIECIRAGWYWRFILARATLS